MTEKPMTNEELVNRITEYLANGGLFNPEMMEHDKVRQLLIDCREVLSESRKGMFTEEEVLLLMREAEEVTVRNIGNTFKGSNGYKSVNEIYQQYLTERKGR